jgi:hypothetical protein
VGRDEIGKLLQKICSITRVEAAKELRRTGRITRGELVDPLGDGFFELHEHPPG